MTVRKRASSSKLFHRNGVNGRAFYVSYFWLTRNSCLFFLPRDAMLAQYMLCCVCLSVRFRATFSTSVSRVHQTAPCIICIVCIMAYWIGPFALTANDLKCHSPVARLFKCNSTNICATIRTLSTDTARRAVSRWKSQSEWQRTDATDRAVTWDHFARLANTLLKDEESARDNHVSVCNFAKYSPILIFSLLNLTINHSY